MAVIVQLQPFRQIALIDFSSGEYIGNVYAPNIANFSKLIRRFYPNDQGAIPDEPYVGNGSASSPLREQYIVRLHLNNNMIEDIPLGQEAEGSPNWPNSDEGYAQAVLDITEHASIT